MAPTVLSIPAPVNRTVGSSQGFRSAPAQKQGREVPRHLGRPRSGGRARLRTDVASLSSHGRARGPPATL